MLRPDPGSDALAHPPNHTGPRCASTRCQKRARDTPNVKANRRRQIVSRAPNAGSSVSNEGDIDVRCLRGYG